MYVHQTVIGGVFRGAICGGNATILRGPYFQTLSSISVFVF